ncbi:MAG: endonuclease/exonuclease/phosphatase family protein [Planctomycetota bacterium]
MKKTISKTSGSPLRKSEKKVIRNTKELPEKKERPKKSKKSSSRSISRYFLFLAVGILLAGTVCYFYQENPSTVHPEPAPPGTSSIQIASFNIQIFGKSKLENVSQMEIIKKILRQFDLIAIQEVRNQDPNHLEIFLKKINEGESTCYEGIIGPRLGRTASKEQYVYIWNSKKVRYLGDCRTIPDPDDDFEREPFVASFKSGNFDFTMVVIHIRPEEAGYELKSLSESINTLVTNSSEKDIIVLGDFNADGDYFDESLLKATFPGWINLITNEMDTMVKTDWTYDRIMIRQHTQSRVTQGTARPCYWDQYFGERDEAVVKRISDHYPVSAQFQTNLPDDD